MITMSKVDMLNTDLKKVGVIVQTTMKLILGKDLISMDEINLLQTKTYSKETFNLQLSLLKKVDLSKELKEQVQDHKGRNRYYKSTVTIRGERYLLCSQWYERNRVYLMKWITLHS